MAWVRFDDKRSLNAKLRVVGLAARGLDEAAICWSAHEEQDGFVSSADVAMLAQAHGCRRPAPLISQLVKVGRWIPEGLEGYRIHDFLEFNPSRADLAAERNVKSEAGRKGGLRSGEVRSARSRNEAGA